MPDIDRVSPVQDWVNKYFAERTGWKRALIRDQARKALEETDWNEANELMGAKKKREKVPGIDPRDTFNVFVREYEFMKSQGRDLLPFLSDAARVLKPLGLWDKYSDTINPPHDDIDALDDRGEPASPLRGQVPKIKEDWKLEKWDDYSDEDEEAYRGQQVDETGEGQTPRAQKYYRDQGIYPAHWKRPKPEEDFVAPPKPAEEPIVIPEVPHRIASKLWDLATIGASVGSLITGMHPAANALLKTLAVTGAVKSLFADEPMPSEARGSSMESLFAARDLIDRPEDRRRQREFNSYENFVRRFSPGSNEWLRAPPAHTNAMPYTNPFEVEKKEKAKAEEIKEQKHMKERLKDAEYWAKYYRDLHIAERDGKTKPARGGARRQFPYKPKTLDDPPA
jgi:hypothetical protein